MQWGTFAGNRTLVSLIKAFLSGIKHASIQDKVVEPQQRVGVCHIVRFFPVHEVHSLPHGPGWPLQVTLE